MSDSETNPVESVEPIEEVEPEPAPPETETEPEPEVEIEAPDPVPEPEQEPPNEPTEEEVEEPVEEPETEPSPTDLLPDAVVAAVQKSFNGSIQDIVNGHQSQMEALREQLARQHQSQIDLINKLGSRSAVLGTGFRILNGDFSTWIFIIIFYSIINNKNLERFAMIGYHE